MSTALFIDPGFRALGMVVYSSEEDKILRFVAHTFDEKGYKLLEKAKGTTVADLNNIAVIGNLLNQIKKNYPQITKVFFEAPAGSQSSRAAKTLGLVAGEIMGWVAGRRLKVATYTQGAIKKAVLGVTGSKVKAQKSVLKLKIQDKVRSRWPEAPWDTLNKAATEHVSDAAAIIMAAEEKGEL